MARTRGFDRPLTTNQLASWIGNALATAWFYGVVAWVLLRDRRHCNERIVAILVIPHVCCVLVGGCVSMKSQQHNPTTTHTTGGMTKIATIRSLQCLLSLNNTQATTP